jgi:hypothetical protein
MWAQVDHFLLSATVFFDFATQLSALATTGTPQAALPKKAVNLTDFPLAASLIAVLRRSLLLSMPAATDAKGKSSSVESKSALAEGKEDVTARVESETAQVMAVSSEATALGKHAESL